MKTCRAINFTIQGVLNDEHNKTAQKEKWGGSLFNSVTVIQQKAAVNCHHYKDKKPLGCVMV